ncbi:MAG: ABC transporter ATP-binding protein [Anaerolineae bacterium]|nr:ABC transporter ATP-binding protein [Anaerolineae bacterium]MCA9907804.1 ABC transporter ATP-binding protein [Anaerolineae bacterium]
MRNHAASERLLELKAVHTMYGSIRILQDVNLSVRAGELVCLLGGNASGKSTTLKTILGLVKPVRGAVYLRGEEMTRKDPAVRIARGIAVVPENRRLFAEMTVSENLQVGALGRRDREGIYADREHLLQRFPVLKQRMRQPAGTLSGGEQQMLAMARALMSRPSLLLMDEPSMGLSPRLVAHNFALIQQVNAEGTAVLVVEQNARMALSIADRGYVLQTGQIVLEDNASNLLDNPALQKAYLG